jgi:hypothetical protein
MQSLPVFISVVFALTALLTVAIFYKASHFSKSVLLILLFWMLLQAILGYSLFYTNTTAFPPRLVLLVLPPLVLMLILFFTTKGKQFIDGLNTQTLTLLHIVRVPVELVLYWLCMYGTIPELMTFEGRNFDIVSGLTAPFIYFLGYQKRLLSKQVLLLWNGICLVLLVNIVVNAVLAAPSPLQQFAFTQPNIAVQYFPFNWLPSVVVPLVLFSHLTSIRQLRNN